MVAPIQPLADMPAAAATAGKGKWMALLAAFLGWMFDGVEIGLFPLVARPSLVDLLPPDKHANIGPWIAVITAAFLVGAATGGVLFGWLGDRLGRVRAMTLSVLTYAIFTGLCGIASSATEVAIYRFIAALGMGGEWSLGVALVMEIWPDRWRALLAGLIGAAANVGFLLIALVGVGLASPGALDWMGGSLAAVGMPADWVAILVDHSGWRLLMLLGAAPALLTFFIRLFVPESEGWAREHSRGTTSFWAARDLLGVLIGSLGPGAIICLWAPWEVPFSTAVQIAGTFVGVAVALVGYTYPVIRYMQRAEAKGAPATGASQSDRRVWRHTLGRMLLAACLSGVALLGTWGSIQMVPSWVDDMTGGKMPEAKAHSQIWSAVGAIVGSIGGALLGGWLGRRVTYTLLCIGSLAAALVLFQLNHEYGTRLLACVFVAGTFTASFYGWLPLYLPELFRTSVRATGQGFGFNFGRILAAIGVLQSGNLIALFGRAEGNPLRTLAESLDLPNQAAYPLACSVISLIYLLGAVIIWFAPETKGKPLPE